MAKLEIIQNEVNYTGVFSEADFRFWADDKRVTAGLYRSFREFNPALSDLTISRDPRTPAEYRAELALGVRSKFALRLDRIEAALSNFERAELARFADVLSRGREWVEKDFPSQSFRAHIFTYASHSSLSEGSSEVILSKVGRSDAPAIGKPRGHGVIFHYDVAEEGWQLQLTVDHSLVIVGGLFLHLVILANQNTINYSDVLTRGRAYLDILLAYFGLELGEDQ